MNYPKLRSLYVDDIPGAKPAKRNCDKAYYRMKNEQQKFRFARRPDEERYFDWHTPKKIKVEPIDREDDSIFTTHLTLSKSFEKNPKRLSKSVVLGQKGDEKNQYATIENHSSLANSGMNSLNEESKKDPYFPHRYVKDPYAEKNHWTGNRGWVENPRQSIVLPSIKNEYFKRIK